MSASMANLIAVGSGAIFAMIGFVAYLKIRHEKRRRWHLVGAALAIFAGSLTWRFTCVAWIIRYSWSTPLLRLPMSVASGLALSQIGCTLGVFLLMVAVLRRNIRITTGTWAVD